MPTLQTLASQMYDAFETDKRPSGEEFIKLRTGHPDWMTGVARAGHGDMLPDDWRYRMIKDACSIIAEHGDDEDAATETIDSDTSIYTAELTEWLGSRVSRIGYVDEAIEEHGWDKGRGIVGAMQMGQYAERREVYDAVKSALEELAAEDDDEAADDEP